MSKRKVAFVSILLILIFTAPRPTIHAHLLPNTASVTVADTTNSCQSVLNAALKSLVSDCMILDRNNACYGSNLVSARPRGNAQLTFATPGDKVSIHDIESLSTSPMDFTGESWGLSLLKLQANLPDAMPGQNVMFLVYGDTNVQNTSGDMRAFYFSSGLGNLNCKEAPDGIIVRSPNHTVVSFTANGVEITIASTIAMRATPNQTMEVQLLEGRAQVTSPYGSEMLQPGEMVSIPMGGASGLEPVGAPSKPTQNPADPAIINILMLTDRVMTPLYHMPVLNSPTVNNSSEPDSNIEAGGNSTDGNSNNSSTEAGSNDNTGETPATSVPTVGPTTEPPPATSTPSVGPTALPKECKVSKGGTVKCHK
jgi:hypothetical protein